MPEYPFIIYELGDRTAFTIEQNERIKLFEIDSLRRDKAMEVPLGTYTKGKVPLYEMAREMMKRNPGLKGKAVRSYLYYFHNSYILLITYTF